MDRPQFLQRVVEWLRAGYPDGIPRGDYVPLVALLRRQLTDDEVAAVSKRLVTSGAVDLTHPQDVSRVDAGVLITEITDDLPSESDIARVRAHLGTFAIGPDDEDPH
ncbi:DUF3349 domain-containing protein [Williamsia sterculiae]|uniref:DUF3349 domain-containing protein n=1 Tax=Williamsia sterculiae TaxID=1344003 RepID=A0A1N7CYZ0_9NOCA|nr:DUF3349 domain-containing protein [Williamsia sterculiae]SIR68750.1 Protein of unknown function [Williamsia sterculiae]